MRKRLLVFASGTKDGGGSGFENLVRASGDGRLSADIVAVVSNRETGGVRERAARLGVPFVYFAPPYSAARYAAVARHYRADFVALSGWLKPVEGLDPKTTFNIHPGPLPAFGGAGMYGHRVHEAVLAAYRRGELTHSEVCMHFVTETYDDGPVFFRYAVPILPDDTPDTLAARVNEAEHVWQPVVADAVLAGAIRWDGNDSASLVTPYRC
ncbi:phosphoribosylglycinamide formyltransferase [Patescibacteria group bacterium]|nr:phosphoribosylglycinamide formyltransferase [Patescibacteria group bacterium]